MPLKSNAYEFSKFSLPVDTCVSVHICATIFSPCLYHGSQVLNSDNHTRAASPFTDKYLAAIARVCVCVCVSNFHICIHHILCLSLPLNTIVLPFLTSSIISFYPSGQFLVVDINIKCRNTHTPFETKLK